MSKSDKNAVPALSRFEGRDVLQAPAFVLCDELGIEAMAVEPVEMHLGETRFLLIEAEVARINYEELKDTGTLRRVHTLRAGVATLVDESFARSTLDAQRKAIAEAKGVHEFPFTDDELVE